MIGDNGRDSLEWDAQDGIEEAWEGREGVGVMGLGRIRIIIIVNDGGGDIVVVWFVVGNITGGIEL